MEKFSLLRRLPKRMVWCLYLACVFGACALFTIYLETENPITTTVQNLISTDELESGLVSNSAERIVRPALIWTPKSINSSQNLGDDDKQPSALLTNNGSVVRSSDNRRTTLHNTKYILITSSSTTTTSSSSFSGSRMALDSPGKRTTSAPVHDTCQKFSMKDSKLILLWTSFFDYWGYVEKEKFGQCTRCRNCRVTTDRTKLPESDAVIFHARDMSLSDLPAVRYPHQRWIFYCLESPPYSDFPGLEHMNNMFNWTMTYRADSDIISQYGSIARVHPSRKTDLQSLQWAFSNKSKSVVWMSSHCPTHGGRDSYVEELKKYIDVDVYGTCGTTTCPPDATKKCLQEFSDKYKFFLAFENTLCKDYITEKFFRTLKYNIIPVVFGGAVYDKFAPPNSYIDALSFKSPKHLAFFLSGVGKEFKLYSNYFQWRKDYSVLLNNRKECDLCSLLHRTDLKPSSYHDFRKWWISESHCQTWKPKR